MSTALRRPGMTREQFFEWADAQDQRYEFDGIAPVAMTGGSINHNRILLNLALALRTRLRGTGCEVLGPDTGVATVGDSIRYPDGLITCTKTPGADRVAVGVVAVFEIVSPGNPGLDRIVKVREYLAVPSILSYVIVEQQTVGVTHLRRQGDGWTATALTNEDTIELSRPALSIPVDQLYLNVDLTAAGMQPS